MESFLIRYIRENPGARHGAIVRAAHLEHHLSERTAARHLSRLIRFGDVVLLADHTHSLGEPGALRSRAMIEVRTTEGTAIIRPDGTARHFIQEEFRVVSGEIHYLQFTFARPPGHFSWWCTSPGQLRRIPAKRASDRQHTFNIEFENPLTARSPSWERIFVNVVLPLWYRMVDTRRNPAKRGRATGDFARESESVGVASQGLRFAHRLTPDAHLRGQVVLPEGYPVGRTRCRVRFLTDAGRFDSAEETRLAKLGQDRWHQNGLRKTGEVLTLSVPRPLADRTYEIEWDLPSVAKRDRWLAAR